MCFLFFFFKQKTAYEMRISDWSSDVCSSDLEACERHDLSRQGKLQQHDQPDESEQPRPGKRRLHRHRTACHGARRGARDLCVEVAVDDEIGRASCRARVWQYV